MPVAHQCSTMQFFGADIPSAVDGRPFVVADRLRPLVIEHRTTWWRTGGLAISSAEQLSSLGLLQSKYANQFAVEDEKDDKRNEKHDDEVEKVAVEYPVESVREEISLLRHQDPND